MKPQQALDILDEAVARLNLPRVGHMQCQEAVKVLRAAIAPAPKEKTKPKGTRLAKKVKK